ncbi:MAG TPA: DUF255 domain-containing protein [Polyangiaceae bacterium]|jgi:hypothetical protein
MKRLFAFVLMAACGGSQGHAVAPQSGPPIVWSKWGRDAFARAKSEHKLVMVDVGIEGCTACRWMHERTYKDPEVVRRVRDAFVAVSVDADQEPDLGARYEPWGWPAEIFLTGDGQVALAIQGSEPAKELVPILDDLAKKYASGALTLEGKVVRGTTESTDAALDGRCASAVSIFDVARRDLGWGGDLRVIEASPVDLEFYRAAVRGDADKRAHALAVVQGETKLLDPVWGGVYIAALSPSWDKPIYERRMLHEAAAIETFADALDVSKDPVWSKRIAEVDRYVSGFMTAPDGTFYSTQKDQPASGMKAAQYWALADAERRAIGIPPIDHGVYTDQNARVAAAYARAWEATGDARWLATAEKTIDALLASRLTKDGWVLQTAKGEAIEHDARYRPTDEEPRPYLQAQAEMGLALVMLHEATGEAKYRDAAIRIGKATRVTLEDEKEGGFFATTARDTDALVARDQPLGPNVQTARFFLRLGALTHDPAWKESARKTLAVIGERQMKGAGLSEQALYARALYELLGGFVEVSILGPEGDARKALWSAAAHLYAPRKLVHEAAPGVYPDRGRATAYVCTPNECSSPISDPAGIAPAVAKLEKLAANVCGGK